VDKKIHTPTMPEAWELDPAERLSRLFSTLSSLRSSNQALVDRLRASIGELRQLRGQLRSAHTDRSHSDNGKAYASFLQEQFGLTRREVEVAQLLAQGRSNQAIARQLKISAHTARHHTQRILSKLEVHSRGEAGAKIRG
jgi:DNA-binding NarL/FixJ family response regulator